MKLIKFFSRSLLKNKLFASITIGSFAVSLAVVLVLVAFIISEYSYDAHLKNVDRMFRIEASENKAMIPEDSRDLLLEQLPELEAVSNYLINSEPLVYEGVNYNARIINSDEGLFSVLSIPFISGNARGIFNDKRNVVITESLAQRIFGNENPLGKNLNISHKEDVVVAAVIKDFPPKSTLFGDLICSTSLKIRISGSCFNDICTDYYNTIVLLQPNVSHSSVSTKLTPIIPKAHEEDNNTYSLSTYRNVYFNTSLSHDSLVHANIKLIKLLTWLTIILLVMAVFNYTNLSVANNANRIKEFGVKKTLGAGKRNLFMQFAGEATITVIIASVLAYFIAFLIQPVFVALFGKPFLINALVQSSLFIFPGIILLLIIAFISSVYPAYVATRFKANDLLRKQIGGGGKDFSLRKSLNILQFAATIAILISLIVITRQINYTKTKDFGFSTEQLVRIPVHYKAAGKVDVLTDKLNTIPGVKSACYSHGTPGGIYSYNQDGNFGKVSNIAGNYRFAETFGLEVIEGRNFYPGEEARVCLINKTAMKQAGWESFEGKSIFGSKVVGLINDFHYENLYNPIGALMIVNEKDVSHVNARLIPGDWPQTIADIEKGFKEVLPDYGFSFQFYDDYFNAMYQQEEKRAASIRIVALIAILISCIGLIGLVEFSTKQRTKEIGIRKVNGARIWEVLMLLNRDFVKWVAMAFIIASPVAFYAMNKWLGNFAYKTNLNWWIFALAGMLVLGIALLTVSWQSWRAATRNPVEALRYE